MKTSQFISIFIISTFCIILCAATVAHSQSRCLEDQKMLLLKLRDEFAFNSSASRKLVRWNMLEDCCSWDGVGCDAAGHVISLELDDESIFAGFENSTSLFRLEHLEKLNLAYNCFFNIQIPRRLSNLTNLTHLNLSTSCFNGQVPAELSTLKSLVILDLSSTSVDIPDYYYQPHLKVENPDLRSLLQNLTDLKELHLDQVNLFAQARDWYRALASSVPNLRVLSLRDCYLLHPENSSLSRLRSLSVLQLDGNNLAPTFPDFFVDLSTLTTLSLRDCTLQGRFPTKILQLPILQHLDLTWNQFLGETLPEDLPWTSSLRTVVLSNTNFSGSLPNSISNVAMLSRLDLSNCKFSGPIPSGITNLTELDYLDFSSNNFTGLVPPFYMSKKLGHIDLSTNQLTGPLSTAHFEGLSNLKHIDLRKNFLTGNLPSILFMLPSLQELLLSNNQFDGSIKDLSDPLSSQLSTLDLSSNNLKGHVPKFFFKFQQLKILALSSNLFSGTLELDMFGEIHNLTTLSIFLDKLDLSDNKLFGEIPTWIWEITSQSSYVNISFNQFTSFQKPFKIPRTLAALDLSCNRLHGELPIPPDSSIYLDYSNNNFNSTIPPDIGNYLSQARLFSLSNNRLTGEIPESICMASLAVLDLSKNTLNGSIPSCLTSSPPPILNLQRNMLSGNIPNKFPVGCRVVSLDLSHNLLAGKFPQSVTNCQDLKVLNFGYNMVEGTFPCKLINTRLCVLVLRSNRFHGDLHCGKAKQEWPNLQIMDISHNKFTGDLSPSYFMNWNKMTNPDDDRDLKYLGFGFLHPDFNVYYRDKVEATIKGVEMDLERILAINCYIDFSSNKFKGKIPHEIGNLRSLRLLNLSWNAFTETIPASLGNLTRLESLDLSMNHLQEKIPEELASLTFLSYLNLSFNELSGSIPSGGQLETFSSASYEGNAGLCGFSLNISCSITKADGDHPPNFDKGQLLRKSEIDWTYVFASIGFATGLGISVLSVLFCPKWSGRFSD